MKDTECYVNKAEVKRKIRVWLDYRTSRQVTDGLLDLIEKLPVTVKGQLETTLESNWISVKDRLPEIGKAILIYSERTDYLIGQFIREDEFVADDGCPMSLAYLLGIHAHWMPLPQKPENEGDAE